MRYHKGKFIPKHIYKYKGDPNKIYHRSGLEKKFMILFDRNPSVLEWASEEIIIPYFSTVDKKMHRYFPDFYVKVGNKKYIAEVKPLRQTKEPKTQKRNTKKYISEVMTYAVNQAKFKAATEFCKDHGWQFKVVTEKELKIKTKLRK